MDDFKLVRPTSAYADQLRQFRQEFLEAGSSMDGTGALRRMEDIEAYIEQCIQFEDPALTPEKLVPATQFLFIRKEDNTLVGMLQVRHRFNGYLEQYGGHIGYSVRPCERCKGYAKEMLHMALPYCQKIGLKKVLITCIDGNHGSEKTILANGGTYESTVYEPDAQIYLKRFWITL